MSRRKEIFAAIQSGELESTGWAMVRPSSVVRQIKRLEARERAAKTTQTTTPGQGEEASTK